MSHSVLPILGFGVIFLIVGALGGAQLGLLATIIFLAGSAVLFALGGTSVLLTRVRRKAATMAAGGGAAGAPAVRP